MNVFDHFQHINLTNDQRNALSSLQDFLDGSDRVFILQGYAGSGKTTLLKGLVAYLQRIGRAFQLMAPTGRAAKVIHQKTNFHATTIHKGIYSFVNLLEVEEEGRDANDISFFYQFGIRNNPDTRGSVLIVDEASMVSDFLNEGEFFRFGSGHLLHDLISYSRMEDVGTTGKIIFVGDPAQLPPVGMSFSPALSPEYLGTTYNVLPTVVEMKEVKRQTRDNGILRSATQIRRSLTTGYFNDFDLRGNNRDIFNLNYEDFLESYKAQQDEKIIICFKNQTALKLNTAIRRDKFGSDLPIQPSDIVIVGVNNYSLGIMNGEFGVVAETSSSVETREVRFFGKGRKLESVSLTWREVSLLMPDENNQTKTVRGFILENYLYGATVLRPEEQRALYIDFKNRHPKLVKGTKEFEDAIIKDPYFNCILLKYGYAVTCHKAQGGEWASAFVFWDKGIQTDFDFLGEEQHRSGKANADFYRWAYTAVTRASTKLFCINPPYFSAFSGMQFIEPDVNEAFNQLTGRPGNEVEVNIEQVYPLMKELGLEGASVPLQDHFIHRWYYLQEHSISIKVWKKIGYEIWYEFVESEKSAAFKYWINGKDVFQAKYQKIPKHTNSDELFDRIVKILENKPPVVISRNSPESKLAEVEFDARIEEERPFLRTLFDHILALLADDELVTDVRHLDYRERYTISKSGYFCKVDFEYNNEGFFGRVLPLAKKCNSPQLLDRLRSIIKKLKEEPYVLP